MLASAACVLEDFHRYVKLEWLVAVSIKVLTYHEYSVYDLLCAGNSLRLSELDRIAVIDIDDMCNLNTVTLHVHSLNIVTSAVTNRIVIFH